MNEIVGWLLGPGVLLGLGYAAGWVSRSIAGRGGRSDEGDASASPGSLSAEQPMLWWASVLVGIAAVIGVFVLPPGADEADVVRQSMRLAGSLVAIGVVAFVAYMVMQPRTSARRARLLLATAFA